MIAEPAYFPHRSTRLPPFERVFSVHGESVLRYLVAAVGQQAAEDCFQDALVAALGAYTTLSDVTKVRSWLLTIAHNKAMDEHRARRRRPVAVADLPDQPLPPLEGDELGLWDAVRALPPRQRDAITHRFANDLPFAEVAAILGSTPEAARQNVREGLKKLRKDWTR